MVTAANPVVISRDSGTRIAINGAPRLLMRVSLGFWTRVGVVLGLTAVTHMGTVVRIVTESGSGSTGAFELVVPVLAMLIVSGHQRAPRGVGDTEADWIIATLVGVVGLGALYFLGTRVPTVAGLWHVDELSMIVWSMCTAIVLFGARHALSMWELWLLLVISASPIPYRQLVAVLGGSEPAALAVVGGLGTAAVAVAHRTFPVRWRICVPVINLVVGAVVIAVLSAVAGAVLMTFAVGALVPVLVTVVAHHLARVTAVAPPRGRLELPTCSPKSLSFLIVLSGVVALLAPSVQPPASPPSADGQWVKRAAVSDAAVLPFAKQFLGDKADGTRYRLPSSAVQPAAAIDVLTTPNLATLRDYFDVVWYPSSAPVDYAPAADDMKLPRGARVVHSEAGSAHTSASADWYAITWIWRTATDYQQVTVVVNQDASSAEPPLLPQPLSVGKTLIAPALWIARQQPQLHGPVNDEVTARAVDIAHRLMVAATATHG